MDILDRFAMREMGFSRQYVGLNRAIEEVAESSLIDSSFSHQLCRFPEDTKSTHLLCLSSNGKLLASCHGNRRIHVTDVNSGKVLHSLEGHGSNPWALSFHPSRNDLLASGCLLGEVRVWDLKTGCCEILEGNRGSGAVASVAFHPEGRLLVIATSNRLLFWDWNCPEPWKTLESPYKKERIRYVKFDRSGQLLYTAITNASGSRRTTSSTSSIPTTVMPLEYRDMVYSRQELIDMRSSLARRHENLVDRYNTLLERYRQLRARYPEYVTPSDPPFNDPGLADRVPLRSGREVVHGWCSADPTEKLVGSTQHQPCNKDLLRNVRETESDQAGPSETSQNLRRPPYSGPNIVQDAQNIDSTIGGASRTSPIANVFQRRREVRERIQQAIRDQSRSSLAHDFRTPPRRGGPVVIQERFTDSEEDTVDAGGLERAEGPRQNDDSGQENVTPRRQPDDLPENHYVPPLSPIQLERLNNAVTYAHDLSQRTLSQFMERHNASMMRLERSYRILEEQAVTLEQNFRRVYEEITRFQRHMSQMASEAPLASNAEGQSWAGGLLRSLSAMQQIITRDISLDDMREAPMVRETGVLLEALSVVLTPGDDQNTADIPREILNGMVEIRDYFRSIQQQLEEIRNLATASALDGRPADYPPELMSVQERLVIGIRMVQDLIRSWKTRVVSSIREESGEDQPSTSRARSETGVSVYQRVLSLWSSPEQQRRQAASSQDIQAETEAAVSNLTASMEAPRPRPRPIPASPVPAPRGTSHNPVPFTPINLPAPTNTTLDQSMPDASQNTRTQPSTVQNVEENSTTPIGSSASPVQAGPSTRIFKVSHLKRSSTSEASPSATTVTDDNRAGPSNGATSSTGFVLPLDPPSSGNNSSTSTSSLASVRLNLSPSRTQQMPSPRGRTILRYSSPFAENPGPTSRDVTPVPPDAKKMRPSAPAAGEGSSSPRLTVLRNETAESPRNSSAQERSTDNLRTPDNTSSSQAAIPSPPVRRTSVLTSSRNLTEPSRTAGFPRLRSSRGFLSATSRREPSGRNPFVSARELEDRGTAGILARDLENATSSLSAEIYGRDRNSGSTRPLISLELGRPSSSRPGSFRTVLQAMRNRSNPPYDHISSLDDQTSAPSSRDQPGPSSRLNDRDESEPGSSNWSMSATPRTATLQWNPQESREWNVSRDLSPSRSGRALVVQAAAEARIARRETVANFVSGLNALAATAGSEERMPQEWSPSTRQGPERRVFNDDVYVRIRTANRGSRSGRAQASRYVRVAGLPARPTEEELRPAQAPNPIEEDDDVDYAQDLNHAINRAIAGAFIGTGDTAIATNILDLTCRVQEWKFDTQDLPNIADAKHNVIAQYAKVHNDGSLSFSHNGQLMACFTENPESDNPIWTDTVLQIISLRSYDKGAVLFHKSFGPNAVSLCISPCDSHIMIGLATRRYLRLRHSPETFAQIFHLSNYESPDDKNHEMKLVLNLNRVIPEPTNPEDLGQVFASRNCTLNCALWLANPGEGFAYGTNKGQLCLIKPLAGAGRREKDKIAASSSNINRRPRSQRYGSARNPGLNFYA